MSDAEHDNPQGYRAARKAAWWWLGDERWADRILSAYFDPASTEARIKEEKEG